MRQRQTPDSGSTGHVNRTIHRRVPPTELVRILRRRVLGIMNHQIGPSHECDVAPVLFAHGAGALGVLTGVRLMVTGINDRNPVGFQPISQGEGRMVHIQCSDLDIADFEDALDEVVIADGCPKFFQRYREVGVLHLARKGLAQGRTEATGGVNVPFVAGHEEGIEERDTLDVVPMGMGDEDMATQGMDAAFHEGLAESVRPGAAIEDNMVPEAERTSTHDVLPPKRTVDDPGFAMDPRVPQNRTFILKGPSWLILKQYACETVSLQFLPYGEFAALCLALTQLLFFLGMVMLSG